MIRNTLALFALSLSFAMAADKPEKGFTALFNGKDLTGWKIGDANENTFTVKDGAYSTLAFLGGQQPVLTIDLQAALGSVALKIDDSIALPA